MDLSRRVGGHAKVAKWNEGTFLGASFGWFDYVKFTFRMRARVNDPQPIHNIECLVEKNWDFFWDVSASVSSFIIPPYLTSHTSPI